MPEGVDYYEILGVARTADIPRIRQAYRRLARRTHPDLNPHDRVIEGAVSGNPAGLRGAGRPGAAGGIRPRAAAGSRVRCGATPGSLRFRGVRLRGRGRAADSGGAPRDSRAPRFVAVGGGRRDRGHPCPGADLVSRVPGRKAGPAARGAAGDLRGLRRTCGQKPVADPVRGGGTECPACSGGGRRIRRLRPYGVRPSPAGAATARARCSTFPALPAWEAGARERPVRLVARLPAGVADGATIVVEGSGSSPVRDRASRRPPPACRGGAAPDFWSGAGDNLVCPLPLTLAEAALGGRIEVPNPFRAGHRAPAARGCSPARASGSPAAGVPSTRGGRSRRPVPRSADPHPGDPRRPVARDLVRELEERYPESPPRRAP